MMGAVVAMVSMAVLFVLFGLVQRGERRGCGSGHCDSCSHECEIGAEGRLP
jgi:hypothetical protein